MSDNEDFEAHQRTWNIFTRLMLYSSIGATVVLLLLLIFVA